MQYPQVLRRPLVVLALLSVLASAGWAAPAQGGRKAPPTMSFASDPCGCSRELQVCLVVAGLRLGRCLAGASTPARGALCYVKFELDLFLCAQRAGICRLTCVP